MIFEKRSLMYIFLIFLLLFAFIPAASAATIDTHQFAVTPGHNTLDLGRIYDGNFVININGTIQNRNPLLPTNYQNITFQSDATRDDVLLNISIQRAIGMSEDWTNVWFVYPNGTTMNWYIQSSTETSAEVTIRTNVTSGMNLIQMQYGANGGNQNVTNPSSVFLFYAADQTLNIAGTTQLWTGSATNIDMQLNLISGSSMFTVVMTDAPGINTPPRLRLDRAGTATTRIQLMLNNSFVVLGNATNTPHWYNFSINQNGTIRYIGPQRVGGESGTVVVNTLSQLSMVQEGTTIPTVTVSARVYNSTNISNLQISPPSFFPLESPSEPISFTFPQSQFSSVQQSFSQYGITTINVHYTPHAILITENNTQFDFHSARLEYISNPQNFQTTFQISNTPNFNHVIISGSASGGLILIQDPRLVVGTYYWRVQNGDGTWTQPRTFQITDRITLTGTLVDGITGDIIVRGSTFPFQNLVVGAALEANVSNTNGFFTTNAIRFIQGNVNQTVPLNDDGTFTIEDVQIDIPFNLIVTPTGMWQVFIGFNREIIIPSEDPRTELTFGVARTLHSGNNLTRGIVHDEFGQPVTNGTVSRLNADGVATLIGPILPGGQYVVSGTSTFVFRADGYLQHEREITASGSSVQGHRDIQLERVHNVTITARDGRTGAPINSFSTFLGPFQELRSTDNGTVMYRDIGGGRHQIIIQASGYYQVTREIFVSENNTHFDISLTRSENNFFAPHVTQFSVRENRTGMLLPGVNVTVYSAATGAQIEFQRTGDDGAVSFELLRNTSYRIVFSDPARGVHREVNLTPSSFLYVIYVDTNRNLAATQFNHNRYIIFNELEAIFDPAKISSIGFDSETTAVAVRYTVFNHRNDGGMTESTTIQLIDRSGTIVEVMPDLVVRDGSTVHYFIQVPKQTAIGPGYTYRFITTASHREAVDGPVTLTRDWRVTFSPIREGFNILPGFESYYTYVAVLILFIITGAIASRSTVSVTVLISSLSTFFFVWIGWLTLPVSAIVFLFLAFILYIFRRVYRGGN